MSLDTATNATLGYLIQRLGTAVEDGAMTLVDAVAALQAADPTLSQQGATGQIRSWRGAVARYAAPVLDTSKLDQRKVSETALRAEPIRFRSAR